MGDFNVAEAEVIMLEIVDSEIAKVFEEEAILWNLIDKGESKYTNSRGVRLVTHVEPNPGMSWYQEGGALPVGGTSRKVDMRVFYTRFAISGTLTGDAIDTTSHDSMLEGLSSRIKEDTTTGIKEFSQQLYEDGKGIKATISAVTTGAAGTATAGTDAYGSRRILKGGLYNFYSSAGVQRTAGVSTSTVTANNIGTGVITFDSVPTDASASSDVIVYAGSYNKAIHGLPYHVNDDTGLYQGQSRATYPKLKAVVIDASSADLSVSLLDKLEMRTLYRTGASVSTDDFLMISSPTQVHAYKSLGYNLKRFMANDKFDGGYKTVEHNGHAWLMDIDCSDKDIYFLRTKTWAKYQVRPFGLLREDGKVLHMIPNVTSTSSNANTSFAERYTYYIGGKCDIGCKMPQMNARLKNLSTTNLATGIFSY